MTTQITPDEALDFFTTAFGGSTRVPGSIRHVGGGTWALTAYGKAGLSTFDYDELTRLVFLAHDRSYRLAIVPSSGGHVGVRVTKRDPDSLDFSLGHPELEEAVLKWRKRRDESWVTGGGPYKGGRRSRLTRP